MRIFQGCRVAGYFIIIAMLALGSSHAFSQVSLSIGIAPPPLPIYAQPACPYDGYLWTPGYWAYGDDGYYWVPGTWVQPPEIGLLWTPCYWGWRGNDYAFYPGYWGSSVGFYGGINYGYGYGGNGYGGGRWQGRHFFYNTAANNVSSASIHHTYADRTAMGGNARTASYNGGQGGVQVRPTAQQRQFSSERHIRPTSAQQAQVRAASQDRGQLATVNGGRPGTAVAATPKSYSSVAQQREATQPLTRQDTIKTRPLASAKSSTGASSNRETTTAKRTHLASRTASPMDRHATASVRSQSQHQSRSNTQSHPVAHASHQAGPAARAKT